MTNKMYLMEPLMTLRGIEVSHFMKQVRSSKKNLWAGLAKASLFVGGVATMVIAGCAGSGSKLANSVLNVAGPNVYSSTYVVLGYNDLGMHCMNNDFSEMCVLPPANTLRATVLKKGSEPNIITSGLNVSYSLIGNTTSVNKTNFWQWAPKLFGVNLAPNMGLFGYGMSGNMTATADKDYIAQGIPATQIQDNGTDDAYNLAQINVTRNGTLVAATAPVVPVSWEMSCNKCHNKPGMSLAQDILRTHDKLHRGSLHLQTPVLCAKCHSDNALGAPGKPGVSSLSSAMHTAHSTRMGNMTPQEACYSCHPGPNTQCLRDVHKTKGMTCVSCHGGMSAVGNPARKPWIDEPRCGSCHNVRGHEYEQPGKLYRDSVGHNGVKCIACHGSPHVIAPSENAKDNIQAIGLQGHAGTINTCTVCHTRTPSEPFNHTRSD